MRLILASDNGFLFPTGMECTGISKNDLCIAHITTASKGVEDREYIDRCHARMRGAGYRFQALDIEDKDQEMLRRFLADKNVLYVQGGNTFYLLKAVRKTGFAAIIREFIERGGVYVGTSAGAYITCPTIETSTWGPLVKDRFGLTDLTALALVPFLLKVHYIDDVHDLILPKIRAARYPVRILRDGQGLLVEEGKVTFFGCGEEVRL